MSVCGGGCIITLMMAGEGGIGCKRVECECVWWGMYYYTNDGRWEMRAKGGRVGLVARG